MIGPMGQLSKLIWHYLFYLAAKNQTWMLSHGAGVSLQRILRSATLSMQRRPSVLYRRLCIVCIERHQGNAYFLSTSLTFNGLVNQLKNLMAVIISL